MRKRLTIIPIILLLLTLACAKVNTDELNEQVNMANTEYDSVSIFTTSQLASLKMIVDNGGTLTTEQKQRALDLYDVLTLLDTYRNTIEALKVDPTVELLQQAVDTWTQATEKATALGWEEQT